MYLDHFDLKEAPFSITPDPRFVCLTEQHRDALAHLLYGVTTGGSGGFVQLTGEVGTGKTTLCRLLLAQLPEHARIALVLNPMLQPLELLRTICDELKIVVPRQRASIKSLTDALTQYLLAAYRDGLRVVLVIDEAQNLSFEAFEQIRMLTNLETATQKLLQVILLGQPELRERLARHDLRQLRQRITARYHLKPLNAHETAEYVEHRLRVAGAKRPIFREDALGALFRETGGFPRLVNVVADRALLGAYARHASTVDADMIRMASREVRGEGLESNGVGKRWRWVAGFIAVTGIAVLAAWLSKGNLPSGPVRAMTPPSVIEAAQNTLPSGVTRVSAVAHIAGRWRPNGGNVDSSLTCRAEDPMSGLCVGLRLNTALLRVLDRPIVLRVGGADDAWLPLMRWDGDDAVVATAQGEIRVPWARIERDWFGDAWLAVPSPDGYDGALLAAQARGPVVTEIHAALHRWDGGVAAQPDRFDDETRRRVEQLQQHFGLRADGLVGPDTLALILAFQPAGPTLSSEMPFVSAPQP